MTTFIVLAVLIALLGVVLMQLFKKPAASPKPGADLANLKVIGARAGDVLSITGAGDDLSDLDFTADRFVSYDAGGPHWFELSGPYRERRVALRVVAGEETEVALHNDARKLTLDDLGLSEQDLADIDERQNPADSFEFDGKVWLYRRSREVRAYRDEQPQPSPFYYWEFQEQAGKRLLAIRKPEGEPFAVLLYTGIPEGDVTVYRPTP